MKAHIIYQRYYDFENHTIPAGGVQTYITNLVPILNSCGYDVEIFQGAKADSHIALDSVTVHGCCIPTQNDWKNNAKILVERSEKSFDTETDLLIFASDELAVPNKARKSIAIQHGIYWDIPKSQARNSLKMALSGARFTYEVYKRLECVKTVVCVDFNFMNWYRAQVDRVNSDFVVVPNFTAISEKAVPKSEKVSIIFARRFYEYRGTKIFAEAVSRILDEYEHIAVTVAGRGPDEEYLHQMLDQYRSKVTFIQYSSEESLEIHADKHIALVPTVGSEGTSLSLLEAMAAKCAVVCTDVGGMTNIVIDGYNGIMVKAGDSVQLYEAMKRLIEDAALRKQLAQRGYETVKYGFSHEKWCAAWKKVLEEYCS